MVVKTHYGIVVDSEKPITGVLNSNAPEFLYEECLSKGIDLHYEEHCWECDNEEHDECFYDDEPVYLIGFKNLKLGVRKFDEDGYEPDEEAEYSAIVSPTYTQVVRSKYVSRCALCSPCFPGQGDLDTPGEFLAYTLPPEVWGDAEHLPIIKIEEV